MQLVLEVAAYEPFACPQHRMSVPKQPPPTPPTSGGRRTPTLETKALAERLFDGNLDKFLLIDCRSFMEYNNSHVLNSVNISCSKLIKRRLQTNKLTVKELLKTSCNIAADDTREVIVYDQCSQDATGLQTGNFLSVLLSKLDDSYKSVWLLSGGFAAFQSCFPYLCESQDVSHRAMLAPLSQPCLPVTNVGPTRILSYLYLGSQQDVLDPDCLRMNSINYVLNISKTCPAPDKVPIGHFHRIPVKDDYREKILPWLDEAISFIEKVRSANGCVIVHCLAGISRSPTVAIAYIMKHMNLSADDAYKYVKDKRPTISPNFNFLGQLLEYQKQLIHKRGGGAPMQPPQSLLSPEVSSPVSKSSPRADIPPDFPENEPVSALTPPPIPRKPLRAVVPSTQAEPQTPTTPTTESRMLFKRSITQSQSDPCNLVGKLADRKPSSPLLAMKSKTIPRPSGLDVKKVSHLGPIFLDLQASETKKSRSGRNSPCTDLLDMLNQGTSNLSVNSPEVQHKNPFVEACEKLHAESVKRDMMSAIPVEEASSPKLEVEDIRSKVEEEQIQQQQQQQQQTQEQPKTKSDSKLKGKKDTKKDTKPLGIMSRRISREKSPAASPTHRRKQFHTKLLANLAAEAERKCKPVPSPSDTSVGFQFGRTRIDTSSDNVPELPPKSKTAKSSLAKAKAKDLPKLCVASKSSSSSKDDSSSSTLSAGHDTSPFSFNRQLSTQSFASDSSGISPSCESETSSLLERNNSSCSSGISPDFPSSQAESANANYFFEQITPEPESARVVPGSINPFQFFSSSTDDSNSSKVTYEKLKDPDESLSTCSSRKSSGTPGLMDRHGGLSSKRCYGSTETSDSDHSETRCNRKTSMLIAGRSQSCEEISSCAREAVSEIVVSSRREYSLSSLDREDDDYDTRSLSSQRSLSSSCEMIEVS